MGPAIGPSGEIPNDPRIDVAEHRVASPRGLADTGHMLEDPLQLAGRKIRRGWQTGLLPDNRSLARAFKGRDDGIGPRVLPDDRVAPGPAILWIPDDGRFALIGDADSREVGARRVRDP